MCAYLHSCLQGSNGCRVVEVLLCPWVGPEVVVASIGHCMRLSCVVRKGRALYVEIGGSSSSSSEDSIRDRTCY